MPSNLDVDRSRRARGSLWPHLGLGLAAFLLSVAVIEIGFRVLGFDFARKNRALEDVPIFYRRPTLPFAGTACRYNGALLSQTPRSRFCMLWAEQILGKHRDETEHTKKPDYTRNSLLSWDIDRLRDAVTVKVKLWPAILPPTPSLTVKVKLSVLLSPPSCT